MSKDTTTWHSERLQREVRVVRWGETGAPMLLYSTAGGDAEECERFLMIDALAPLLEAGRLKVYSVDSVSGEGWLDQDCPVDRAIRLQHAFDAFVYHEVVPAIRTDCQSEDIEVIAAGASIGAYNALAAICRHPDVFSQALCLSGTYDLTRFLKRPVGPDFAPTSPLHFVPGLEGAHLERLRQRFVLLAHGEGQWEEPAQSWRAAEVLGAQGIPNRVDSWGPEHDHDWVTWREMLPRYLEERLA